MFNYKLPVWTPTDRCTFDKRFSILPYGFMGVNLYVEYIGIRCLKMAFSAAKQDCIPFVY